MTVIPDLPATYAALIAALDDNESISLTPDTCTVERRAMIAPTPAAVQRVLSRYNVDSPDVSVLASRFPDRSLLLVVQQRYDLADLLARAAAPLE